MKVRTIVFIVLVGLVASLVLVGCGSSEPDTVALTFLEFYDPACPFCQEMEGTVEDLRRDYEDRLESFEIIDITTDEGLEKVDEYGIFLTPTFVLLDADGEELDRITGAAPKETMVDFVERGIADVSGEDVEPSDDVEGVGTTIE
jgi:thiol-disulfide isomerase/thioredoxin